MYIGVRDKAPFDHRKHYTYLVKGPALSKSEVMLGSELNGNCTRNDQNLRIYL